MAISESVRYEEFNVALSTAGLELSAAEVHGLICGSVCNQMKTGKAPDLRQLLTAGADIPASSLAPLQDFLELLLRDCVDHLHQDQSEFQLLLADDDEPLHVRMQSLADWCRGYLLGLLHDESLAIDELGSEAAEVARDMLAVSDLDVSHDNQDSEWDLLQVEEYIRVGVQVIFENLYAGQQAATHSGGDGGVLH